MSCDGREMRLMGLELPSVRLDHVSFVWHLVWALRTPCTWKYIIAWYGQAETGPVSLILLWNKSFQDREIAKQ